MKIVSLWEAIDFKDLYLKETQAQKFKYTEDGLICSTDTSGNLGF